MESLGKWLEKVTAPDIESRRRVAQYFSHVLVSDQLRGRWAAYYKVIDDEYKKLLADKMELEIKLAKADPEKNKEEFAHLKSRIDAVEALLRTNEDFGTLSTSTVVLATSQTEQTAATTTPVVHEDPQFKECRHQSHGIEKWNNKEAWSVESGWRKGGSSPTQFCGDQKIQRERKFPNRKVVLVNATERHKSKFDPFKRDYYLYSCTFEDRWDPVYKLSRSSACGA